MSDEITTYIRFVKGGKEVQVELPEKIEPGIFIGIARQAAAQAFRDIETKNG